MHSSQTPKTQTVDRASLAALRREHEMQMDLVRIQHQRFLQDPQTQLVRLLHDRFCSGHHDLHAPNPCPFLYEHMDIRFSDFIDGSTHKQWLTNLQALSELLSPQGVETINSTDTAKRLALLDTLRGNLKV